MFDSPILNVIIGLLFIYLLYSLLATIIQEIIAANLNMRGLTLKKSIRQMLENGEPNKALSQLFYQHPLIKCFRSGFLNKNPSYLDGGNFSKVIIDLLRGKDAKAGENHAPAIQKALDEAKTQWAAVKVAEPTNTFLKSLWADAQGDVEKFRKLLESWFNDTMDHASGSYKRKTQLFLFLIGLCLAAIFNIDTIAITKKLSGNSALAKQLADNASVYMETHKELEGKLSAQPYPVFISNDSAGFKLSANRVEHTLLATNDTSTLKIKMTSSTEQQQLDSMQIILAQKSSQLIDSANAIIHTDINNVNDLLGLGWKCHGSVSSIAVCIKENFTWKSLIGWILTALAISMGAPFWFDLLNRFMKIRGSARKPENRSAISKGEDCTDSVG